MSPRRSLIALLAAAVVSTAGCADIHSRTEVASGDRDGLALDIRLAAGADSLVVDTTVRNTRSQAVHLDADQCGRVTEVLLVRTTFQPDGSTYSGSLDAVKRMVLSQQRSGEAPDSFAPRRVTGGSDPPPCTRPTQPVELAPGAAIAEGWELPFASGFGLAAVGSASAIVRAEAVESVAADTLGFLDILPAGAAETARLGRTVTVTLPASAVLDRPASRPDSGPSLGQKFDRMIQDPAVRDFIDGQPADSWRRATIIVTRAGPSEFRAVTTAFERALVATLAADGAVSGQPSVPGIADRTRVFERRPATLPPGIQIIPEPNAPVLTKDVVAGRLTLPSGRLVADGALAGDAEPLPDRAAPGTYPVSVTVGRVPDSASDQVAFATVAVSDAPTVSWARRTTIAVDGGTAAFTSAEGNAELARTMATGATDIPDRIFDSLTAHDDVVTEAPIAGGLDLVLFASGYGDGGYDVWVGLDAGGRPTRFVIDFAIVHLGWP